MDAESANPTTVLNRMFGENLDFLLENQKDILALFSKHRLIS
jgi:hypothetical protein